MNSFFFLKPFHKTCLIMFQGHSLATQFGHSIVDPVPSLFTFKINDPLLSELAGVIFLCFYTFLKCSMSLIFEIVSFSCSD